MPTYYTINEYASKSGRVLDKLEANEANLKAKQLSNQAGLQINQVPDNKQGQVPCYAEQVLKKVFNEILV